ncbi:MAG: phage tail tape measure protein, partial [Archaeoglobus sp.]|uniref:phage tail tape measure protein n=1 Tax=Archaeoglobus sp. TaxID=1872626 RepID=UPI001D4559AA
MPDSEILKIIVSVKDQATDAISNITNSLSGLQKAALVAGSALGALAVKKSIDAFASFDDALQKSIAIMGDVDEAMREKLANTAREVAKELAISHEEAARSYYYLASAGLSAAEALKAMPEVAKLAKAGALDMAEATDIATDIMTAFGQSVEDLTHINDVLIATVTKSNTNLQQLGEAMKYLAPSAHAVGWSLEEMSAAVGLLSNAGIKASQAGTYLRQVIAQLLDPTDEAKETLEKLGLTVEDVNPKTNSLADILQKLKESGASASDIMQIFGVRAGTAVLALMDQGVPALRQFTEEVKNAGGITDKVAKTQMESFREQMNRIKSILTDIAITIGGTLAPKLEEFAGKLSEVLQNEETMEKMQELADGIGEAMDGVITALTLVLNILSKIPPEGWKIIGVFTALTAMAGPILGVVKVFSGLWSVISSVTGALGGLSGIVSTVGGALGGLSGIASTVGGALTALAGAISLPVVAIGALIAAIVALVFNIGGFRDKVISALKWVAEKLYDFVTTWIEMWTKIYELLYEVLQKVWDIITSAVSKIVSKIKELGQQAWEGIKSGFSRIAEPVKEKFNEILAFIAGLPGQLKAKAIELGWAIVDGFKAGLSSLFTVIKDSLTNPVEEAVNTIKSWLGISSPSKVFE